MPKPNDPCTCGSGKKYKKCCFHEQSKQKSTTTRGGGGGGCGGSDIVTTSSGGSSLSANNKNPLEGHNVMEILKYCRNEQELNLFTFYIKNPAEHGTECREMIQHLTARECVVTDFLPLMSKVLQLSPEEIKRQVPHEIQQYEQDGQNDYIVELFKTYVFGCCDSLYMAEKDDEHMKLLRKSTPRGMVEHERSFAFEKGYLETYLQTMDKYLSKKQPDGRCCFLLDETTGSNFPAVDLAAGAGAFTFEYAKYFCGKSSSTTNFNLTWFPTEWENPDGRRNPFTFLRESLHWMLADVINGGNTSTTSYVPATFGLELTLKQSWANNDAIPLSATDTFINAITVREILFVDATGKAAHVGDKVSLVGLSKVEYNGKDGIIQGKDVKTEGRFAVMLLLLNHDGKSSQKAMSFKSTNILVILDNDDDQEKQQQQELLKGLMKRARVIDLQNNSTWCNISELNGRCAIVTCTSLLTQVGHRAPDIWKNTLNCAGNLLAPGGILLLHDTIKFGGGEEFGNARSMQDYVTRHGLGLELEERSEPIKSIDADDDDHWGRMILMVWRKK